MAFGLLWELLGLVRASGIHLGGLWAHLRGLWGALGARLGAFWLIWGALGLHLGTFHALGAQLFRLWAAFLVAWDAKLLIQ